MLQRTRTLRQLTVCTLVLFLFACQSARVDQSQATHKLNDPLAVNSVLDNYIETGAFPFLYARVEDKYGDVVYEHGAVNRELIPYAEVNGDTWIRIWSMSKIVTISVALDLVEDGVLKLEDPVSKYIPEFETLKVAISANGTALPEVEDKQTACPLQLVETQNQMAILDLINHTAGFYYAVTGIPCLDEPLNAANLPMANNSDDFIQRMAKLPLILQPGSKDYYGTNTTVLGIVAERATGKSLKQLVEERVTGPLKINGLQYGLPDGVELLPKVSGADDSLRFANEGELDIFSSALPDYDPTHELYLGGEGMLGTAGGYADFIRMLINRGTLNGYRLLEQQTVADMVSPHTQLDNEWGYNGYNIWVTSGKLSIEEKGIPGLWLGGGYEGTHYWVDPEQEIVGVIMSQIFAPPESDSNRDEHIRSAIYKQLKRNSKSEN
ncbi:MAG: beta-lactamase family protein [Gammaproteobacteria bacterium]|nr:beta-lactamase family protein [Gammaproteobacteria bacterium]